MERKKINLSRCVIHSQKQRKWKHFLSRCAESNSMYVCTRYADTCTSSCANPRWSIYGYNCNRMNDTHRCSFRAFMYDKRGFTSLRSMRCVWFPRLQEIGEAFAVFDADTSGQLHYRQLKVHSNICTLPWLWWNYWYTLCIGFFVEAQNVYCERLSLVQEVLLAIRNWASLAILMNRAPVGQLVKAYTSIVIFFTTPSTHSTAYLSPALKYPQFFQQAQLIFVKLGSYHVIYCAIYHATSIQCKCNYRRREHLEIANDFV